jgi:hypothetical protein
MQTWVEGSLDKLKSAPSFLGAWNKRYLLNFMEFFRACAADAVACRWFAIETRSSEDGPILVLAYYNSMYATRFCMSCVFYMIKRVCPLLLYSGDAENIENANMVLPLRYVLRASKTCLCCFCSACYSTATMLYIFAGILHMSAPLWYVLAHFRLCRCKRVATCLWPGSTPAPPFSSAYSFMIQVVVSV